MIKMKMVAPNNIIIIAIINNYWLSFAKGVKLIDHTELCKCWIWFNNPAYKLRTCYRISNEELRHFAFCENRPCLHYSLNNTLLGYIL